MLVFALLGKQLYAYKVIRNEQDELVFGEDNIAEYVKSG